MKSLEAGITTLAEARVGWRETTSPQNPALTAFPPNLTIIILPDPPETGISGVFLGIRVSMQPVLTPVKSP